MANGGEANYTAGDNGVYVLNNTQGTTEAQDMLGTSLMLLGFAPGGMSLLRRCRLFNRE
jgi:hypothetical protein